MVLEPWPLHSINHACIWYNGRRGDGLTCSLNIHRFMFHQYSLNLLMKIFVPTFSISNSPFFVSPEPALFSFHQHQVGSVFRHTSWWLRELITWAKFIIKSYALPASPLSHYPGIVSSSHISHISGHHMSRADPGTREDRRARSNIAEKVTMGIKAGAYYNLTSWGGSITQ